jgi:hypothetical protein
MNEGAIFLIGIVIFAITIYGVVMAGGIALTKVVVEQDPQRQPKANDGQATSKLIQHPLTSTGNRIAEDVTSGEPERTNP